MREAKVNLRDVIDDTDDNLAAPDEVTIGVFYTVSEALDPVGGVGVRTRCIRIMIKCCVEGVSIAAIRVQRQRAKRPVSRVFKDKDQSACRTCYGDLTGREGFAVIAVVACIAIRKFTGAVNKASLVYQRVIVADFAGDIIDCDDQFCG